MLRAIVGVLGFAPDDVAHVHVSEGGSFVREGAVIAAASLGRGTVVVAVHGARFAESARGRRRLVAWLLRRADAIVVLGEADGAFVAALAPGVPVELVLNPTPIDADAPPAAQTAELVLFGGEVGPRKGADVLERAWPLVVARRPQARCVVVGPRTGEHVPQGERMEVRGAVGREAMRRLLHACRVVALPSRQEALPMMLTEAMAAGRPFVATPVGAIPSIRAGGTLVPVGDAQALADALVALLADPAAADALGRRGQQFCAETQNVRVIDERIRAVYARARGHR
jgi:glycosyltransferase involved in cell wall biosynthesis